MEDVTTTGRTGVLQHLALPGPVSETSRNGTAGKLEGCNKRQAEKPTKNRE